MKQGRFTLRLEQELLDQAKRLDINVSKAARQGITSAIEKEKRIEALLDEK